MHSGTQSLRADIDVDNDALRFAGESGVAVGHGEGHHLIWTRDDAWKVAFLLPLHHGLNDAWVVGA